MDLLNKNLKYFYSYCVKFEKHYNKINNVYYNHFVTTEKLDLKSAINKISLGKIVPKDIKNKLPNFYRKHRVKLNNSYYNFIRKHKRTSLYVKGLWYYGDIGKNMCYPFIANNNYDSNEIYFYNQNKVWWDGYNPLKHKTIVINNFNYDIDFIYLFYLLKHPYSNIPIQNHGVIPFLAENIIITSNKSPKEMCKYSKNDFDINDLLAYFKIIELKELNGNINEIIINDYDINRQNIHREIENKSELNDLMDFDKKLLCDYIIDILKKNTFDKSVNSKNKIKKHNKLLINRKNNYKLI
jgi:hypothetical protein